jgi:signal peptidase I
MPDKETDTLTTPHNNVVKLPKSNKWRSVLSTMAIIIIAPLIALCLTAYVFQSYQVDGPSMQTTLMNNDRLIVNKIPRTWSKITGHPYIPKRGDIIIFSDAGLGAALPGPTKQLIKRVIALPGDHLVIQNDVITVYNKQHPKGFDPDKTLGYFKGRTIPITTGTVNMIIPKDEVFVCGDNRTDSLDSRVFGPVPVNNIVGQLSLRILPLDKLQAF